MEAADVQELQLDWTHQFRGIVRVTPDLRFSDLEVFPEDVILSGGLQTALEVFSVWRRGDLLELCEAHSISFGVRDFAPVLYEKLMAHICSDECQLSLVCFRRMARPRTDTTVARVRDSFLRPETAERMPFYTVADDELKRSILREWRERLSTESMKMMVCAVCARKTKPSSISLVSPGTGDLSLLRNDALPAEVLPTTYALDEYDCALLHPKGMTSRWDLSDILVCASCRVDWIDKERLPKFALANCLYYGHDELPLDVRRAFLEATPCDKVMIARARASRISFRFSEIKGHPLYRTNPVVSQHCVKGNVMVMPQDSTQLRQVLPPSADALRDTFAAVFVGQTKPTRDTIARLRPLLVRKSRVQLLIQFLIEHNVHYATGDAFHGYSQRNMDALFEHEDDGQDESVPCSLEIGFLELREGILAAESDYTGRERGLQGPGHGDDLLMETVGYTNSSDSPVTYNQMKMKALSQCLSGGKFVRSQAGSQFIPDFENPSLLSWLFPHLDPWGIGGFFERSRPCALSLDEQLSYLLQVCDSPFERDPDFAFVYYNILQKKSVCETVNFRVQVTQQQRVVRALLGVDNEVLQRLINRCKQDSLYKPTSSEERQVMSVLAQVTMVGRDLPGTAAHKLALRNEIRSLVYFKGTPAFFITLNPSDIYNPLVRLYAGHDIRLEDLECGMELTNWQRRILVANNPSSCAVAFHEMISAFTNVILRYGREERGLLGYCEGFYGTVEAQGRGTLHCHMLIWLKDHPSPQDMRDAMGGSTQYTSAVFTWLESLIKCELLGCRQVVVPRTGETLDHPVWKESEGRVHPCATPQPVLEEYADCPERVEEEYEHYVNELVHECQWHDHTDTCWKYLRRGEPRDDAHCRMRMDGATREYSEIDPETGSVLLRRLHPRIANYNDLILFLMRSNMDIKHVGSGEGAKALVYYVTDYVTKAPMPVHVGLSALLTAVEKAQDRVKDVSVVDARTSRGALTTTVNCLLSRQETSYPQVMSYLVGGGDHYASHRFRPLHFRAFERAVDRFWKTGVSPADSSRRDPVGGVADGVQENSGGTVSSDDVASEESVTLRLGSGDISAINQAEDYLLRSRAEEFESLCLYEFVGMVEKVSKISEARRLDRRRTLPGERRGRPEGVRGHLDDRHSQSSTHILRKRSIWVVPIVLGDALRRPDRGDVERERWAMAVLIMFVPWRHPRDLKEPLESWYEAYDRRKDTVLADHATFIRNMTILSECKDARAAMGRQVRVIDASEAQDVPTGEEREDTEEDTRADEVRSDEVDTLCDSAGAQGDRLEAALDELLGVQVRVAVDMCYAPGAHTASPTGTAGLTTLVADGDLGGLGDQAESMRLLKRRRRPVAGDGDEGHADSTRRSVRRRPATNPSMQVESLSDRNPGTQGISTLAEEDFDVFDGIIQQVVAEKRLDENKEQHRAFDIVARHVCYGQDQLLMYIGGMGGTGKTYVIHAILRVFELLGRRNEVLVAAPTGAAAILVGGHTIHALTFLPDGKKRKDLSELVAVWKHVRYLICDEISMVGALFMCQVSKRLQQAKGDEGEWAEGPFGGVNVIFTGDFAQLKPVKQPSLYCHRYVRSPGLAECQSHDGVGALMGVYLWRLVKTVVMLKWNQRQTGDPIYAALLERIRVGACVVDKTSGSLSDLELLRSRELSRIRRDGVEDLVKFCNAPIIVGRKKVRDLLNLRLMAHHARSLGADVHVYYAEDRMSGEEPIVRIKQELWRLSTSVTNDVMGRLPLFAGMKVMVLENIAFSNKVVNGSEGVIESIRYKQDTTDGRRYAAVAYVKIPGAGVVDESLETDVVPIFPEKVSFRWTVEKGGVTTRQWVRRSQLPLLPAYAYTDYKSQGRSLDTAIVDLESAQSLQGVYVMLSRVRSLSGLAILRTFSPSRIQQRASEELRDELVRLAELDEQTTRAYEHALGATGSARSSF